MDYEQMRQLLDKQRESMTEVFDLKHDALLEKYNLLMKELIELKTENTILNKTLSTWINSEKKANRYNELPDKVKLEVNSLINTIASHYNWRHEQNIIQLVSNVVDEIHETYRNVK